MGPFRENAFYLLAWRAFLVALIALALIVTRSFELAAAFLIGANVALLFSLGLIVWSERLTEQRIVWTRRSCSRSRSSSRNRDRKRIAPGAAVHAAMLLNLRDRSKVRMSRSNITGGEAPSHSGALPRR
jgi:hypothetical protein